MKRFMTIASLLLMCGCDIVDPVMAYRAAAQQLHFSLERVEPKVELAFPLEQSRIRFRFELGVRNDSSLRLHARGLNCKLSLDSADQINTIGDVGLPGGLRCRGQRQGDGAAGAGFDLSGYSGRLASDHGRCAES